MLFTLASDFGCLTKCFIIGGCTEAVVHCACALLVLKFPVSPSLISNLTRPNLQLCAFVIFCLDSIEDSSESIRNGCVVFADDVK